MENFDQKIKHINIADDKKEFSVKGVKGLKLFCYLAGEKIFKFKYQLESGNYTTF